MMAGARFVRADLHVHTFPDSVDAPRQEVADYIAMAVEREVGVLGITDHNTTQNVRVALGAAKGTAILVLPGMEISTHEGHLLALFAPTAVTDLEEFAAPGNLRFSEDPRDGTTRSDRGMLDLVGEIARRGGLAIPAHVDTVDGLDGRIAPTALAQLLSHRGLAGLEFSRRETLRDWYGPDDKSDARREAWMARQRVGELAARGLARLMSSDAHSPDKVGNDRASRTLTRLRLDDPNFAAVRNALLFNPKARCKAEVDLPRNYPRVLAARFEGGFLDGVELDLSENLTCLIGGRGSGKSTALLAIRAALGSPLEDDEDPDDLERMPDRTVVRFIDELGSERVAVRQRGDAPVEEGTHHPIELTLADLAQGEPGRLARGYETDPASLRRFLDQFVDLESNLDREDELLAKLADNAAEVTRTGKGLDQILHVTRQVQTLEGNLTAAQKGRIEDIANWAARLASEGPLLECLGKAIDAMVATNDKDPNVDLDALADEVGADLTVQPAKEFVEGPEGLRVLLTQLAHKRATAYESMRVGLTAADRRVRAVLERWRQRHEELTRRLDAKQHELAAQGLTVEAGAARAIAGRLNTTRTKLAQLKEREKNHKALRRQRRTTLCELEANRAAIYERRRATLKIVTRAANESAEGLTIHLAYARAGDRGDWARWLGGTFRFRSPRVQRIADALTPQLLSEAIIKGREAMLQLSDADGMPIFDRPLVDETLDAIRTWQTIFALETMRLEDRVRIEVQEAGSTLRRPFDHLSAGQQRSILLGLLLSASRDEPLVIDQPEDHLDAQYIASAIVRHLEAAKERRQVILATHSANLTVLGDAELVVPMYAERRHGEPRDPGAVDRPATREHVCALLEGGVNAYRRRGERYGFTVIGST